MSSVVGAARDAVKRISAASKPKEVTLSSVIDGKEWWLSKLLRMLLPTILYFGCGVAWYLTQEGWDVWTCFYFLMVMASTVGYGDLKPTTPISRFMTVIFILFGIGAVFAQLSTIIAELFTPLYQKSRAQRPRRCRHEIARH